MPSRPGSVAGRSCRPRCRLRRCARFSSARRARRRAAICSRGASMRWPARCSRTSRRASARMRLPIRAGRAPSTRSIRRRSRSPTTAAASRSARTSTARSAFPARTVPARYRQYARNFEFFGAPVGLLFTIDRSMGPPQWSDLGMYIQTVMLLARAYGLDTCSIEAWTHWHKTASAFLALPAERDGVLRHGARPWRPGGADQRLAVDPRGPGRLCEFLRIYRRRAAAVLTQYAANRRIDRAN